MSSDAMDPADVPDELVQAALKAYCVQCSRTVGHRPYTDHEEEARTILAAALPLYAQQIRTEQPALHDEFGLRVVYTNTLEAEGAVGETLGHALAAIDQLDAQPDGVLHRTIIQRPVGNWREIGDGRG